MDSLVDDGDDASGEGTMGPLTPHCVTITERRGFAVVMGRGEIGLD